ncbi:MAG: hypothetical protein O6826_07500 [Acidobacteria bacterium]|nr:hypothetical protein [Acidobacteriota bacterium]
MIFQKKARPRNFSAVIVLMALLAPVLAEGPDLEPEELVALHLEAIGPPEALSALQNRTAQGSGKLQVLMGGFGTLEGPAIFVSEGPKIFLSIDFDYTNYDAEQVSFDGDKAYLGYIDSGVRSELGEFLYRYDEIIKEGLLGGVLSTAWPLLDLETRRPRLNYRGLKKVNDQELLDLRYRMRRGGTDFNMHLYFEPETFRHRATTYQLTIPAGIGTSIEQSSSQRDTRFKLEEWFSDFRSVDGLDLPTHWTIQLTLATTSGTYLAKWEMIYSQITHDLSIDPGLFALY